MDSVWVFTNHIIVKSGANLKYQVKDYNNSNEEFKDFNIHFGAEVWIQDIFATGIDDLV